MKTQNFLSKKFLVLISLLLVPFPFWLGVLLSHFILLTSECKWDLRPKSLEKEIQSIPFSVVDANFSDSGLGLVIRANSKFLGGEFALKKGVGRGANVCLQRQRS